MRHVFISHSHANKDVAKSFVDYLLASLKIADPKSIVCTSVPGHMVTGRSIHELLREKANDSGVFFVLITPSSLESGWVAFEMGAAWAMNRMTIPILGPEITHAELPEPARMWPSVQIKEPDAAGQLVDRVSDAADELHLDMSADARSIEKCREFVEVFRALSDKDERENSRYFRRRNPEDR